MSEDERPEEDPDQDELVAAFAALGGPLTANEFVRLLGSDEYYGVDISPSPTRSLARAGHQTVTGPHSPRPIRGRSGCSPRRAPMHKNTVGRSRWTKPGRRPSGQLRECVGR